MSVYLGVDIGTYESKGVLVDGHGAVLGSASRPHGLIVPQAGWAEHRAEEDWWEDFVWLARKLIAESGLRSVGDQGNRDERDRPLHAACRRGRSAADERRALWRRHPGLARD